MLCRVFQNNLGSNANWQIGFNIWSEVGLDLSLMVTGAWLNFVNSAGIFEVIYNERIQDSMQMFLQFNKMNDLYEVSFIHW